MRTITTIKIVCLLALITWAPRLNDALFVDEAGSFWSIGSTASNAVQGETYFYYFLLSEWSSLFGRSEIALRSLSCLFVLLACLLFLETGRLLNSRSFLWSAPLASVSYLVVFAAVVARPYSAGVFFGMLSLFALASWKTYRRTLFLTLSVLSLSAALYCHPTFIFILPIHLYIIFKDKLSNLSRKQLLVGVILISITALPAFVHSFELRSRLDQLQFISDTPDVRSIFVFFVSVPVLLTLLLIAICKICIYRNQVLIDRAELNNCGLALIWFLAPKGCALLAGLLISPVFLVPRYTIFSSFGEALVAGCLLASIAHKKTRIALWLIVLCTMTLPWLYTTFPDTQWKPAANYVKERQSTAGCQLFAVVGLIEATKLQLLLSEPTMSFIKAPLEYYGLKGTLLPVSQLTDQEKEYFKNEIFPVAEGASCNILMIWDMASERDSGPAALIRHMRDRGFTLVKQLKAGVVTVQDWQYRK